MRGRGVYMAAGFAAVLLTSACSGTKSTSVAELTQYDKQMSCTELEMDIAEATFLRDKAERNKSFSFKYVVMPLSYPSTYMSAGDAIEAASNRIEYLSRLSEIKGCKGKSQYVSVNPDAAYGHGMPQHGGYPQPYPAPQALAPQMEGAAPAHAGYGY